MVKEADRIETRHLPQTKVDIGPEMVEFSKDSDIRLGEILATVNSSPKSVLLLMFRTPGNIYNQAEIRSKFNEIYSATEFGETNYRTVIKYCDYLVNRGFLNEVLIDPSGSRFTRRVGYSLTEAGVKYARPAAALALDFELNHKNISLFEVFHGTHGNAAENSLLPHIRAKILMQLAGLSRKVRAVDLAKQLNVPGNTIGSALKGLDKLGLVQYESVQPNTGKVEVNYKIGDLPKEEVKETRMMGELSQLIIDLCGELVKNGNEITSNAVFKKIPEEISADWHEKKLRGRISEYLTLLDKAGYLKRGKYKGSVIQSEAEITNEGRLINNEFLANIEALSSDDEEVREIVNNRVIPELEAMLSEVAQKIFPRYFEHSQMHKLRERKKNKAKILSELARFPNVSTRNDLSSFVNLHESTIRRYLELFLSSGSVICIKIKGVNYFSFIGVKSDRKTSKVLKEQLQKTLLEK